MRTIPPIGLAALVCLASACGDWGLIYETYSSDEGGGSSELELQGRSVRLRESRSGPGIDRRTSGTLTPAGLDALVAGRAAVTRAVADAVEQCGYADTTTFVHHLEDDVGPYTLSYCDSSAFAPAAALGLVTTMGDIIRSLRKCEDNATITIGRGCSPDA